MIRPMRDLLHRTFFGISFGLLTFAALGCGLEGAGQESDNHCDPEQGTLCGELTDTSSVPASALDSSEGTEAIGCGDAGFRVEDGFAVIDAVQGTIDEGSAWEPTTVYEGSVSGEYLATGSGNGAVLAPGDSPSFHVSVAAPKGVYRLFFRTRADPARGPFRSNDLWFRATNGSGQSIASLDRLVPVDASSEQGTDGFARVYSYEPSLGWTWMTAAGRSRGLYLFVTESGVVDLEFSVRSLGFAVDRIVLADSSLPNVTTPGLWPKRYQEFANAYQLQTRETTVCNVGSPDDDRFSVWVTSDLSDPVPNNGKGNGDPDDVAALVNLFFLQDQVNIRGIATDVTSKDFRNGYHFVTRELLGGQGDGSEPSPYEQIQGALQGAFGSGYLTAEELRSRTYQGGLRTFAPGQSVQFQDEGETIDSALALYEEARRATPEQPLYVLNWGALTDVALALAYGDQTGEPIDDRVVVISHGTHPGGGYNRFALDREAGDYVQARASDANNGLRVFELKDMNPAFHNGNENDATWSLSVGGESCGNSDNHSFAEIRRSPLGCVIQQSTGEHGRSWDDRPWLRGQVDFSDGSTYLLLLGYAGGLRADGLFDRVGNYHEADEGELRQRICADRRERIVADILERAAVTYTVPEGEVVQACVDDLRD